LSFFALASILVSLAAVSSYINHRYLKLPTTVGVMLVALITSLLLILAAPYLGGFRGYAAQLVKRIDFDQIVLHGMLAFLLFAGAIHVKLKDLGREWLPISLLAVLGTLTSTFIIGGTTWLVLGWLGIPVPFMHALLFGAIISPTDPIAVLGIMKSVGAPKQLEVQIAGESLFNDGLAVVVFLLLLDIAGMGKAPAGAEAQAIDAGTVAMLLIKEIGGALVLGLAVGGITYQMLKRVDNYQFEVLLTLALAMGLYALADALHLSAPIAIVIAGLLIGNQGRALAMSNEGRENVDTFWELIDGILNVILFMLIGLELLVMPIRREWLLAGGIAIAIVLLARFLVVAAIIGALRTVTSQSRGAIRVLTWGGLRGGISVAMALSLPANESRSLLLTLTYIVVIFSLLVQGLTVGRLIRRVKGAAEAPKSLPSPPSPPSPPTAGL